MEGALDDRRRAILESRLKSDPDLARELDKLRQVTSLIRESASSEPLWSLGDQRSYWPRVEAAITARRPLAGYGPMAALAGGLAVAIVIVTHISPSGPPVKLPATNPSGPMMARNDVSRGSLAHSDTGGLLRLLPSPGAPLDLKLSVTAPVIQTLHGDAAVAPTNGRGVAPSTASSFRDGSTYAMDVNGDGRNTPTFASNTADSSIAKSQPAPGPAFADAMSSPADPTPNGSENRLVPAGMAGNAPIDGHVSTNDIAKIFGPAAATAFADDLIKAPSTAVVARSPSAPNPFGFKPAIMPGGPTSVTVSKSDSVRHLRSVALDLSSQQNDRPAIETAVAAWQQQVQSQTHKKPTAQEIQAKYEDLYSTADTEVIQAWLDALGVSAQSSDQDRDSASEVEDTLRLVRQSGYLPEVRAILERDCETTQEVASWRILAHLYSLQGMRDLSVKAWRSATDSIQATAEDWYQLGQACEAVHSTSDAQSAYRKVLGLGQSERIADAKARLDALGL